MLIVLLVVEAEIEDVLGVMRVLVVTSVVCAVVVVLVISCVVVV